MKTIVKFFSVSIILVGLILISLSIKELYQSNQSQKNAMAKAEQVIQSATAKQVQSSQFIIEQPSKGDVIGTLEILKLNSTLPIIEGIDEEELEKGVGHYPGTALPTEKNQIVLSGHRDTVFKNFDQLNLGDIFTLNVSYGSYHYKITKTEIVGANDLSVITSDYTEEILTVTTCYPFGFVGNAPNRYIITANRID
ncbi:class D sortase [Bacillus pinisoli]|uniref:class D sortase n=1 Tax=Bacillus pinisoli TaxID=2901866 RepID=UPI001FF11A8D|nr:class D sortase [Bacillus pinisoli]